MTAPGDAEEFLLLLGHQRSQEVDRKRPPPADIPLSSSLPKELPRTGKYTTEKVKRSQLDHPLQHTELFMTLLNIWGKNGPEECTEQQKTCRKVLCNTTVFPDLLVCFRSVLLGNSGSCLNFTAEAGYQFALPPLQLDQSHVTSSLSVWLYALGTILEAGTDKHGSIFFAHYQG